MCLGARPNRAVCLSVSPTTGCPTTRIWHGSATSPVIRAKPRHSCSLLTRAPTGAVERQRFISGGRRQRCNATPGGAATRLLANSAASPLAGVALGVGGRGVWSPLLSDIRARVRGRSLARASQGQSRVRLICSQRVKPLDGSCARRYNSPRAGFPLKRGSSARLCGGSRDRSPPGSCRGWDAKRAAGQWRAQATQRKAHQ